MIAYDVRKVGRDIMTVSIGLFQIMIPTLIVVKIAQEIGFDDLLVYLLSPVMSMMDLPATIAVVLVTTMLTNPYAGLIVAASVPDMVGLTIGQTSIIALFMLFTHGLPLEAMVSAKVGVRLWFVVLVRMGTGIITAIGLAHLFALFGWYQDIASLSLPQIQAAPDLIGWLAGQVGALLIIQLVIILLVGALEFLRVIGVEAFMIWMLTPLLRFMGIGHRASTIAIVGVTLGLSFGSGLLMKDVRTGTIAKKDVFGVVCFVNLLHSVFEDSAVVFLLGPSLFIILGVRVFVAVIITMLAMRLAHYVPEAKWHRYLTNDNIPRQAG